METNEQQRQEVAQKTIDRLRAFSHSLESKNVREVKDISREQYEILLNQLAQLRIIADRAALIAISDGDMTGLTVEDATAIKSYLDKTAYMMDDSEGGEIELDLVRHVVGPLSEPQLAGAVNYISMANRDTERRQRIRDELAQLKVLLETALVSNNGNLHCDWRREFEMAKTALLFALGDNLTRPLLMSLSPSVRLAEKLTAGKSKASE